MTKLKFLIFLVVLFSSLFSPAAQANNPPWGNINVYGNVYSHGGDYSILYGLVKTSCASMETSIGNGYYEFEWGEPVCDPGSHSVWVECPQGECQGDGTFKSQLEYFTIGMSGGYQYVLNPHISDLFIDEVPDYEVRKGFIQVECYDPLGDNNNTVKISAEVFELSSEDIISDQYLMVKFNVKGVADAKYDSGYISAGGSKIYTVEFDYDFDPGSNDTSIPLSGVSS